jgi:D-3-phosphoglycerate dehydrogenase
LILSLGRRIFPLVSSVRDGKWDTFGVGKPIIDFSELRLGLIGFGQIPQNLYHKVKYLFKEIFIFDPYIGESELKDYEVNQVTFFDIIRKSDYISIHCPYTEESHHLFDERQFQLMKHTAYIINTSRGKIINSEALHSALQNRQIAGAALDVLEKEPPDSEFNLAKLDNVIITPHISFYSESSLKSLKYQTALNVVKILSGEKLKNVVNESELKK